MAHLMRRAGFGDPREELEERASKGYEAVVEELLEEYSTEAYRSGRWPIAILTMLAR